MNKLVLPSFKYSCDEYTLKVKVICPNEVIHIRNPGGYAWKIFQERVVPEQEIIREERKNEEIKAKREQYLNDEYDKYRNNELEKYTKALSNDQKTEIQEKALKITMEKYKDILPIKKTLADTVIRMYTRLEEERIICEKYNVLSFEEWVSNNDVKDI